MGNNTTHKNNIIGNGNQKVINTEAQELAEYNETMTKFLLSSETGKSAEYYREQLFPTLTEEIIKEQDEKRNNILKNIYK